MSDVKMAPLSPVVRLIQCRAVAHDLVRDLKELLEIGVAPMMALSSSSEN
jgi:hypothetical protein